MGQVPKDVRGLPSITPHEWENALCQKRMANLMLDAISHEVIAITAPMRYDMIVMIGGMRMCSNPGSIVEYRLAAPIAPLDPTER
jgi:hypothetical protein